ncbi:MAG: hypothetical protein ACD_49C00009G0049 [uncultured bacterium (gcode 4)]|uniref:Uncharacterized protein n=1 Tax=uncultured bacterium (gcode 4) TaxID=1234023 RepID=K2BX89_9BACT|nr:MAG: hypothetical protein ACD_49C00009G0049 [uncultured bacterium (gcode 4)]
MKKIIVIFLFIIFGLTSAFAAWSNCKYDKNAALSTSLWWCVPQWAMESKENKGILGWILSISSNQWYQVDNVKNKIIYVTQKLVILAWILAIWGLVYSGFTFVLWLGDAEKVKKAKNALQWSLLGFLIAIISQQLINATINFIYWIS